MLKRRTDLALEAAEALTASGGSAGVVSRELETEGVPLTVVEIRTEEGARAAGRPVGRYVTLDLRPFHRREREGFGRSVRVLAEELRKLLPPGEGPVLVVSLGNRAVTPDAVGPLVHDQLLVTRHLVEDAPESFGHFRPVAAVAPGVLGSTGVESGELAQAVAGRVKPQCVVAVDALAAQSVERLCTTVQLSNSGISPGSGVGNHRRALDQETLGVPVVAIGVPTVVDGATLALDILTEAGREDIDPQSLGGEGAALYLTPRDIDVRVKEAAKLIAYGIDLALQPSLTLEDLEALIE